MLKKINREVQEYYDSLKFKSTNLLRERQAEVYTAIPQYKVLDFTLKEIRHEMIQNIFSDKLESKKLKSEIELIIDAKRNLLIQNGYPEDYLSSIYKCDKCKDTGIVDKTKFCECYKAKVSEKLIALSNINEKIKVENFDNFDFSFYEDYAKNENDSTPLENITRVVTTLKQMVNNDSYNNNFYLFGHAGRGKSFLCHSVLNEYLKANKTCYYAPSQQLFNIINSFKFSDNTTAYGSLEFMNYIKTCDLLVIDDLGAEKSNDFTLAEFFDIIDTRLRKNRPILISSNLTINAFSQRYDERFFSRLVGEFTIFEIQGNDIRQEKRYGHLK